MLIAIPGKLYGRGATDDKGPVAGWINALEAFQKTKQVCGLRPATPIHLFHLVVPSGAFQSSVKIKDHTPRPPSQSGISAAGPPSAS